MVSGIWLPIVTPFKNGLVDTDALQRLAEHYLDTELSGFIALGTTGGIVLQTLALWPSLRAVGFRDEGGFVIDLPWPDSAAVPMIAAEAAE